jgi:SAM-dependent methyltransferase
MACCCTTIGGATERQFGEKRATEDLAQYRAKGVGATARLILAGLAKAGPLHGQLLDVGSGVGALTFELLDRGLTSAVGVDLSSAYVAAAVGEAARRGRSAAQFIRGDFVDLAARLPAGNVVTLDRVICCYPDAEQLLDESLRRTDRYLALSYPRDVWYVRAWVGTQNLGRRIARNPFRTFVHSATAMETRIRRAGFELRSRNRTRTWCADVYERRRTHAVG